MTISLAFPMASKPFRWRCVGVAWRSTASVATSARHGGFTLIELMLSVALVGILLSIAIPSFQSVIQRNRATAQANNLLVAFNLARSEAIKRGEATQICPSSDSDPPNCTGGTDWRVGWLVRVVADGEVVRVWEAPTALDTLSGPTGVTYLGTGYPPEGFQPACLSLQVGEAARRIMVNETGRAAVDHDDSGCP